MRKVLVGVVKEIKYEDGRQSARQKGTLAMTERQTKIDQLVAGLPEIRYYKVVPGGIEPCSAFEQMMQMMSGEHSLWRTLTADGEAMVSTICLGFDINWGMGKVALFESAIVLQGAVGEPVMRYATWEEAKAGHEELVAGGWRCYEEK